MRVYVVVVVFAGCTDEVKGFVEQTAAQAYADEKAQQLGIEPGLEAESEHAVEVVAIEVDVPPASVMVRRAAW